MQEIKDCPICKCGGKVWCAKNLPEQSYIVICKRHQHSSGRYRNTEIEAIADWNKWVDAHIPSDAPSQPTQASIRREILDEAARCVCGNRENQYGSPEDNFKLIAALWGDYLRWEITPVDVAMMLAMRDIAKIKSGTMTRNSFVDAAGYIACGGEIAERMEGNDI